MSISAPVVITCGPSYEPIDEVRRITNHSTGELGITLANRFAGLGWPVICLIGIGATWPEPLHPTVRRLPFTTNGDLLRQLSALAAETPCAAVYHAAALCDFRVQTALSATGDALASPKLSSRAGTLTLTLEPAEKVIGQLRRLFPRALLVGWKYELSGTPEEVQAKGRLQMQENRTDLCILNGAAYGEGFGALSASGELHHLGSKPELCAWLTQSI